MLASFVLDTVDHLRTLTGAQAPEPKMRDLRIREVSFSIPYDPGTNTLLLSRTAFDTVSTAAVATVFPAFRLPQALDYLKALDPRIVFDRARLVQLPEQRIARLEITIRL